MTALGIISDHEGADSAWYNSPIRKVLTALGLIPLIMKALTALGIIPLIMKVLTALGIIPYHEGVDSSRYNPRS